MEATLLTFKIILDSKGNIVSDLGGLPMLTNLPTDYRLGLLFF
jgi:hypothetical protein